MFSFSKIPKTHLILFILTFISTLMAGAIMQGGNPLVNPFDIHLGIPFSLTLMLILGCHEFGHYYYALKHNVDATLPYFLPAPPYLFIIGTWLAANKKLIGNKPQTLKLTQKASDCVLHTISLSIAMKRKKPIQR